MWLRSGYLSAKVTIQKPVITQDEAGQSIKEWTDVATVWANLTDISGREFMASAAVQNIVQTKITIRYRTGIVPAMRVVHRKYIYNIEAVLGQDSMSLLLMCSGGTNEGTE